MGDAARPVPTPNGWRLLAGFLLAPTLAAVVFNAFAEGSLRTLPLILIVGVAPWVLLVGLPLYLMLRCRFWPTPLKLALAGALVALTPWLLLSVLAPNNSASFTSGDCLASVNGVRTACGWLLRVKFLGQVLLSGGFAGLIFWLVVIWRDPRFKERSLQASTQTLS